LFVFGVDVDDLVVDLVQSVEDKFFDAGVFVGKHGKPLTNIPIWDKELLHYFLKVDRIDDESKKVIKSVIERMVAKEKK
jgi:hypothetical protein